MSLNNLTGLLIISIFAISKLSADDSVNSTADITFSEYDYDETPFIEVNITKPAPVQARTCAEVKEALKKDKKTVRDCYKASNGQIYFRIENRLEWRDARDTCRLLVNSDLISIHDFEEKMLLNSLALNNYFNDYYEYDQRQGSWIGLYRKDFNCDNEMEWTDGTPVDYEDYIQDEPNCAAYRNEHCVFAYRRVIKHTGVVAGWNDGECNELLKSICKITPEH